MLSGLIVPGCLLATLLAAACRRLPAYDLFVEGAREGIAVAVRVLPNLAAMLVAIGLMQASGLMDALCRLAAPAFEWLGLPGEVAPLVLLRPMSGSASLALVEKLEVVSRSTIREKLLTYLSRQAEAAGSRTFTIPMGRVALAEYLCTDRSAMTRELAHMKAEGLIDYDKRNFTLLYKSAGWC